MAILISSSGSHAINLSCASRRGADRRLTMEDRESLSSQMRCRWFLLCSSCEHQMYLRKTGERELMEKYSLHMSIIGGGIGGLATASALQRQGIQVAVFEGNPELREIGAGLTLWANGVQVRRHLGLAAALGAGVGPLTNSEAPSAGRGRLARFRRDSWGGRRQGPQIGINRQDLV